MFRSAISGASQEAILDAETRLGVTFSDDYAEYVSAFGFASANGHELTGVCGFPRLDVVAVTEDERGRGHGEKVSWYVIERLGIDGMLAWQDGNGNVFITAVGSSPEFAASSLLEFIS